MELTDAQWAVLEPLFRPQRREDGRGRPWQDTRAVLNGVFWVLRTGAPWHDLPRRYPPYQTCHRRFQQWQRCGLLTQLLQKLAEDLRDRGKLDLSESFIDASFSSAKKGALLSALLAAVKAAKSWRSATAMVFLSPCTWPALRLMKPSSSNPPSSNVSSPKLASASECSWLLRTNAREAKPRRKTAASCGVTGAAGKSNACSRGFIIFVASSFAGNTTQKISWGWCSLPAL